jgi:DMSO/TMAO reductase YedYZ heme-binding membrane subunit
VVLNVDFWTRRVGRPALHVLVALPLASLLARAAGYLGGLGANPIATLTDLLGLWGLRFLLASLALICTGFFGTGYTVMQATLIFRAAPPDMRSRMLGVLSLCIGLGPAGFFLLGGLAEWIGAAPATVLCSLAGVAALAFTRPIWRVI